MCSSTCWGKGLARGLPPPGAGQPPRLTVAFFPFPVGPGPPCGGPGPFVWGGVLTPPRAFRCRPCPGLLPTFVPCAGAACMPPVHVAADVRFTGLPPHTAALQGGRSRPPGTFIVARNVPGHGNGHGRPTGRPYIRNLRFSQTGNEIYPQGPDGPHTCGPYDRPFCGKQNRKRVLSAGPDRRGQDPALPLYEINPITIPGREFPRSPHRGGRTDERSFSVWSHRFQYLGRRAGS